MLATDMTEVHLIQATHIAPQAQAWLESLGNGRPLHIFPQACNLVNEQGQVLSLVTSHIGPGPLAVVLPPLHFPNFITIDSPITFTPLTLPLKGGDLAPSPSRERAGVGVNIGKLTIDLTTAVPWNPVPPWHNQLDLDLIRRIVTNHPDFQPAVPLDLATQMQQALQANDLTLIQQSARQLAGLGPGLTPAGDDFLVGVLYGIIRNVAQRPLRVRYSVIGKSSSDYGSPITDYGSLITTAAVPHTTTLSANLLQAAGRGEASQAWHDLLAIQTLEVYGAYHAALGRILHTGHSSGSDALLGFLMALNWSEQR